MDATNSPLLSVRDLSVAFRQGDREILAVDRVSFEIKPGQTEHEMRRVRGDDITIVFQEPMTSLNPLHTIEKQIAEILLLHRGVTGAAARARIIELLTQVGIPDPESRLESYPHQLSGGQRQRRCCSFPTTSASCAKSPIMSA